MRVLRFRLSGDDYTGVVAEAMYLAAAPFGFDRIGADLDVRGLRSPGPQFIGDADVSGVSAWVELAFDGSEELIAWAKNALLVEPAEPNSTAAYQAILAAWAGHHPDCTRVTPPAPEARPALFKPKGEHV